MRTSGSESEGRFNSMAARNTGADSKTQELYEMEMNSRNAGVPEGVRVVSSTSYDPRHPPENVLTEY